MVIPLFRDTCGYLDVPTRPLLAESRRSINCRTKPMDQQDFSQMRSNTPRKRKRRGVAAASSFEQRGIAVDYLPIDFWNARSIFSLFASQQACAALAACMAWLAAL